MFIYLITNKLNGKYYVGQTSDLKTRWKDHSTGSYTKVQRAIQAIGSGNFVFECLGECIDRKQLDSAEIFLIWLLGACKNSFGYNQRSGGSSGAHNEESLKKMSEGTRRQMAAHPERREAFGKLAKVGRVVPTTIRNKISESHKARYLALGSPAKGRKFSQEIKDAQSIAYANLSEEKKRERAEKQSRTMKEVCARKKAELVKLKVKPTHPLTTSNWFTKASEEERNARIESWRRKRAVTMEKKGKALTENQIVAYSRIRGISVEEWKREKYGTQNTATAA